MIARAALILMLLSISLAVRAAQFGPAQYPIKADDGELITNFNLTVEQVAQVARLPGMVALAIRRVR